MRLTLTAAAVTPSMGRRILSGTVLRYGETGLTSAGPLAVEPGALRFPADLTTVTLTREHDRTAVRGHLVHVDDTDERLYVAAKVAPGPEGDEALAEAAARTRAGLSFDIENVAVRDGVIVAADVVAVGQVADPAFNSARIDQIAASRTTGEVTTMTPEQRARLAELAALNARDEAQEAEYAELAALAVAEATTDPEPAAEPEPAPEATATAARRSPVPSGVPSPRPAARTNPVSPLTQFIRDLASAPRDVVSMNQVITAALADITQSGVGGTVEAPAWTGELWDGIEYKPKFQPLLAAGDLTNYKGIGWRWVDKPQAVDYAGDKTAITTAGVSVEDSTYTAARLVVAHDIDRKFFDFPGPDNEAFLRSYLEAAAESIAKMHDAKAHAYLTASDSATTVADASTTMFEAIGRAIQALDDAQMGTPSWVMVNSADRLALLNMTNLDVPAFLAMFGINPESFVASSALPAGTVQAGVRQTATYRTVKGQPIQVQAQNIPNGGVDLASFAYWAIEQHTAQGIQRATFAAPAPASTFAAPATTSSDDTGSDPA